MPGESGEITYMGNSYHIVMGTCIGNPKTHIKIQALQWVSVIPILGIQIYEDP